MRHLPFSEVSSCLDRGRPVEQLLEERMEGEDRILRIARIDRESDGMFSVAYFEVYDQGSEDAWDVYEFASYDPDMAYGDITQFESSREALAFASSSYGALPDRYVNVGMVQDEYGDKYFPVTDGRTRSSPTVAPH